MIYLVLDNIRSAWNVGALMRTCDGVGSKLILIGYTPKPIGNTLKLISKTSIGAENTVDWKHFETDRQFLNEYPKSQENIHLGIEISEKSTLLYELIKNSDQIDKIKIAKNIFLWLGNEIHGLNPNLIGDLDGFYHLPMKGKKESLNVSSTGAIVLYFFDFILN
jgi:23S rRNA (guanosine2251-2'-O)-methyltransferase